MRVDELIDKLGNAAFFLRDRLFKLRSSVRGLAPSGGARPSRGTAVVRVAAMKHWLTGGQAVALLRQHQWAICAVVIAGIALATVPGALRASDAPTNVQPAPLYFYDLKTEKLFAAPSDLLAPIAAPSGGESDGVRAHLYTCGSCSDPMSAYIGYLEKQTDAAKQAWQSLRDARDLPKDQREALMATISQGTLVGPVSGRDWYPLASTKGQLVVRQSRKPCEGGQPLSECDPLSP